jgi:serine protease Do
MGVLTLVVCTAPVGVGSARAGTPAHKYSRRSAVVEAVERARPAVVNLNTKRYARKLAWPFGQFIVKEEIPSLGTGCIISRLGYIVTNWHVVKDVDEITVTLLDKTSLRARLVVRDPDIDLAILKVDASRPLPELTLGSSSDLMIGETVIAVGNAFGYRHTVTTGVVSALGRSIRISNDLIYRNLIQTDASINPGNSGGPLLNINGEMIGISAAIRAGAEGIGFAIPVDTVKQSVSRLLSIKRLRHTWHGAILRELTAAELARQRGAAIVKVEPKSPAAKAGLARGDIVVALGQRQVLNTIDFQAALLDVKAGQTVKVTYMRGGRRTQTSLTLQRAPIPETVVEAWQRTGMELEPIASQRAAQLPKDWTGGLRVMRVHARGAAAGAGLRTGDIIVGMAGFRVTSLNDLAYILNLFDRRVRARLYVVRGARSLTTQLIIMEPKGHKM